MGFFSRRKKKKGPSGPIILGPESVFQPQLDDQLKAREIGPWDITDVPDLDGRMDLGVLRVPAMADSKVSFQVEERKNTIVCVSIIRDQSAIKYEVFAAPRTEEMWDDVRPKVAEMVSSMNGEVEEVSTDLGTELQVRLPVPGRDDVQRPLRIAGFDGPRWFLRVTLEGKAAFDDAAAEPFIEVLRNTVVVRGDEPHVPGDLLPIVPPTVVGKGEMTKETRDFGRIPDLLKRGPEITEIH